VSVLAYVLFWLAAIVLPGAAIQRVLRLRIDTALVLPLGTALCAASYAAALASGQRFLFLVLLAAVCAAALATRGAWSLAEGPALRDALWPWALFILLLVPTQYRWNLTGPDGDFLLDPLLTYDTTFHVGLSRELTLGWPPQVPGLAGFPLGYHLGLDLVRAAALSWAGSDPFDQCSRLDVTWTALALILALRAAARRLGGGPLAVTLSGFSLLFTDFSWIFATSPQAHWWTDLLRGNVLLSLFLANPAIPALALALGTLLALGRYLDGEGRGYLLLAALQAVAVPHFKVFLGAHLLVGLVALGVLRRRHWRPVLAVALPAALSTALLVLGSGGRSVEVAFEPLGLVRDTRQSLGLDPFHSVGLLLFAVVWLVASLGPRLLGLTTAARALRDGPAIGVALGAMALVGWPLGLLLRVSARQVLPGEAVINDAAYLVEQSGPLLWLFTVLALAAIVPRRGPRILLATALTLALPATVQFVLKKASLAPDVMPGAMLRAARALEARTQPGDVVMQRPAGRFPPAPVVFASRRVPYDRYTPYLTQFALPDPLDARHEQVARFFRTHDPVEACHIAAALGARALVLYGDDRVRFPLEPLLERKWSEDGASIYTFRAPAACPSN
jgi:hypothetical protein